MGGWGYKSLVECLFGLELDGNMYQKKKTSKTKTKRNNNNKNTREILALISFSFLPSWFKS